MGLHYRRAVLHNALRALGNGFNDEIASSSALYGLDPFTLDFTPDSPNFKLANIDKSNIEVADILTFPGGCLYTEEAEDSGEPRGLSFSGAVLLCSDFYIRDRSGVEGFDVESPLDRIEDAALTVMNAYAWPVNQNISMIFTRRTKCVKDRLIPLGDGVGHRVSIQMQINVFVK